MFAPLRPLEIIVALALMAVCSLSVSGQKGNGQVEPFVRCGFYIIDLNESVSISHDGDSFYAAEPDGVVRAISSRDGSTQWTAELGGAIASNIVTDDVRVFVISTAITEDPDSTRPAYLRALNKTTGITQFVVNLPAGDRPALAMSGNTLIVSERTTVKAYSAIDGTPVWSSSRDAEEESFLFTDGGWAATSGNAVTILEVSTGTEASRFESEHPVSAVAFSKDRTFVGDNNGNVVSVSGGSAHWRFKTGGRVSSLIATSAGLVAASHDNFVYLLSSDNGKVMWRRRMPGRIADGISVVDSQLLVRVIGDGRLFIVGTDDGKIVDQIDIEGGISVNGSPLVTTSGSVVVPTPEGLLVYGRRPCEN